MNSSLLLILVLTLLNGPIDVPDHDNLSNLVPDRIVVRLRDDILEYEIKDITAHLGGKIIYKSPYLDFYTIEVPKGHSIEDFLYEYRKKKFVLYADRIAIGRICWTPDDPYFSYQWHLDSLHLDMESAWDIERGDTSVVIAVVDCGVAYEDYPIPSYEEHPTVKSSGGWYRLASDLNGVGFVQGYDFVNDDSHPNDNNGHGTHVAGIIAQATNNNLGMAGMIPDCSIMPVKVLNYAGWGYSTSIADGIVYAANNGADVINLSLTGAPGNSSGWSVVHDAVKLARDSCVVVVASAGNESVGQLSYPAGFEEVIAVAATEWQDSLAYYSQFGQGLDLSAPGGDLLHDRNDDNYGDGILQQTFRLDGDTCWVDEFYNYFFQGTSMSAPIVSGLAGLLKARGIEDPAYIEDIMYFTARDLGAVGYDIVYGWGIVDPSYALSFRDTIPPQFGILVLQNPYLEKWVDIWVFSSECLKGGDSPPDSVVVSIGGTMEEISLRNVPTVDRTYHSEYNLPLIEEMEIAVIGFDVGRNQGQGVRNYSFGKLSLDEFDLSTPDKFCKCSFLPNSVAEERYILSGKLDEYGMKWMGINNDRISIGEPYIIGTDDLLLSKEFSLAIRYELKGKDILEKKIAAYHWDEDLWRKLESLIDIENNIIYAKSDRLGVFRLFISDEETESCPYDNMMRLVGPNPIFSKTEFLFTIREPGRLSISVYDLLGREVKEFINNKVFPGEYRISWDGRDTNGRRLPNGSYIIHSEGLFAQSIKVVLLR